MKKDPREIVFVLKQLWRYIKYYPHYWRERRDEKSWVNGLDVSFNDYVFHEWLVEETLPRLSFPRWDWQKGRKIPNWKLFRDRGWVFDKPKPKRKRLRFVQRWLLDTIMKQRVRNED